MNVSIRQEQAADYAAVFSCIKAAFQTLEISDHTEHLLVERLRKAPAFVPELSLVAEVEGQLVGHILLSRISIKNGGQSVESLALAPVSVLPEFQRKGIGAKLIRTAHAKAAELGFGSSILVGHEKYYPRFGYEPTSKYGIELPFEAPEVNCMVVALRENGLLGVQGLVEYPPEFFE
jgi:predicted N-acetyltransferase YhbS